MSSNKETEILVSASQKSWWPPLWSAAGEFYRGVSTLARNGAESLKATACRRVPGQCRGTGEVVAVLGKNGGRSQVLETNDLIRQVGGAA